MVQSMTSPAHTNQPAAEIRLHKDTAVEFMYNTKLPNCSARHKRSPTPACLGEWWQQAPSNQLAGHVCHALPYYEQGPRTWTWPWTGREGLWMV